MLLAIGLIGLFYLMAYDGRPMAEYGLIVDRNWRRHALAGLAIGVVFYAAYVAAACGVGVFSITTDQVSLSRGGKAALGMFAAMPLAAVQQIIFSGYLPSSMRDRYSRWTSIIVPSLLFGVCGGIGVNGGLFSARGSGLAIGMTLIAVVLCSSRLLIGNLSFPAGLLAGAIMVRRLTGKLHLLDYNPTNEWAHWIAPNGDPRQGPAMWALLCLPVIGLALALRRWGEHQPAEDQQTVDASFKRIMPFSNLLGLAPLDVWLAKLAQARFRVGIAYIPRAVVSTIGSTLNTVLTLPERTIAPLLIKHEVPDPVFIVGVHRSGTTHLHNLLALDPRFCTPRNYQVYNPHGFLTGWLTTFALGPFMTVRRPMDAVQLTAFSPQEEEFAIACMTRYSPYWFGCFPKQFAAHERFIYPEKMTDRERSTWSRQFVLFLRKVTFWSRKNPLLKSPYNTARVAALRKMFPRAKFVHIVRHPHATYRSNMHLAEHGWAVFQVQNTDAQNGFASNFLKNYYEQESAYYRDTAELPEADTAELRFEDLEADPIGQVRRIYAELRLEFTAEFERRLNKYLASIAGYRKNKFRSLPVEQQRKIDKVMGQFASRWGYDEGPAARDAA